jgi:hypothetical protein
MTRHFADWALKIVLLWYIVARFVGGPAPEARFDAPPPPDASNETL